MLGWRLNRQNGRLLTVRNDQGASSDGVILAQIFKPV
jgi:hypothetical protein